MDEFHFIRPAWLWLLPPLAFVAWRLLSGGSVGGGWQRVVDARLKPHVLARPDAFRERRLPAVLGLVAALAAVLALAGPAWDRLPVPAFRSDEALVVAMDLSRSMDAGDVEPSRLARAKLKLLTLLDRRTNGQTALVVFSAHAFTVTPLTTDNAAVAALVGALTTDIMPSQGSYPEAGLTRAASLVEQAGMSGGRILLITDAAASPQAFDAVRALRARGFTTSVLAVGTAEGAPIPRPEGGFLSDDRGQVVVPQLDADSLRRLALAGGGRFASLTADDGDLDTLFAGTDIGTLEADGEDGVNRADVWRDQGIWLTLLLLPIVALGFRRGWVYAVVAAVALPAPDAHAFGWRDLWQRPDQQAAAALEADETGLAAALFEDPQWSAAANYRAGNYAESAERLAGVDTPDAHYNRGNALAKSGQLESAISAYDRALTLDPGHADAEHNRALVREILDQQLQLQLQQQQGQAPSQSAGQDQPPEAGGERARQSDQSREAADGQSQAQRSQNGEPQAEDEADSQPDQGGREAQADASGESPQGGPEERQLEASLRPEDLEEWASEQAAEQWLRRVPQDPGGLLRRKFRYQYQRLGVDQEGNYVWPGDEAAPW